MEIPRNVTVIEVGPRDGFQNVKEMIPLEDKLAIIQALIQSGVRQMEITSFVNPKWLPQMADAAQVAEAVLSQAPEDFRAIALAPNLRGVQNAVKAGLKDVTYVISASESHNRKNVNRSRMESLEELSKIMAEFPHTHIRVSLAVSFGCPFDGNVGLEQVVSMVEKIREAGVKELVLCDTIGVANPLQVQNTVKKVKEEFPDMSLGLHFHDTRGLGIANIYAGLLAGVDAFETSVGGLGGCPFAPGSAGNTATEDMLNLLNGMEIHHGIHMKAYMEAVETVKARVKAPITGRMASMCRAGV